LPCCCLLLVLFLLSILAAPTHARTRATHTTLPHLYHMTKEPYSIKMVQGKRLSYTHTHTHPKNICFHFFPSSSAFRAASATPRAVLAA